LACEYLHIVTDYNKAHYILTVNLEKEGFYTGIIFL
ncbi:MAG: hypothetical protein PWQ59_2248, partial [Thermoanaerobacterium sp.]|nr:hypothetical protein [Thermoanaerobacterium sp.]